MTNLLSYREFHNQSKRRKRFSIERKTGRHYDNGNYTKALAISR